MEITAFDLAKKFVGMKEVAGEVDNPQIMAMLKLDASWPEHDEVPWCSALVNYICWLLRLPRSKSLRARSWLRIGVPIPADQAVPGNDVVILERGKGVQPGPEVIKAPGHVGFFAGYQILDNEETLVRILGGNQGNEVDIDVYPVCRILGIRRLT